MKFGIMFANAGPFAFPDHLESLARSADEVGIESIWTVEHVVVPVDYKSAYPYSKSGKMPGPENAPIPDPILPLAFAAAVTKRLRLGTGVVILPQRHPTYVAKEMATLDVLSDGRAMLGVGIGWLREEFAAVGVPFKERAARTNEAIRAIRSLWKETPEAFAGTFYAWGPVECHPKPVQKPGPPIVIGGHSSGAARRAAHYGNGFFPARGDYDALPKLLSVLRDECAKIGRNPDEIELTTGTGHVDLDAVRRYQDLGIARLAIAPPAFDKDGIRRGLHDFADQVIAKL
ncbi:MAG: LLM class F420-dependent oxidoreductase [Candidatus Binatia bacterium]